LSWIKISELTYRFAVAFLEAKALAIIERGTKSTGNDSTAVENNDLIGESKKEEIKNS
jgi:hypothetical protein